MSHFSIDDASSYYEDGDIEFDKFLKSLKGTGDEENAAFRYRFLKKSYSSSLSDMKLKQAVVIKVIGRGRGVTHLNYLMKYVGRELESQEGENKSELFDQNDNEIPPEEFSEVVKQWSENFSEHNTKLSDNQIEAAEENERIKSTLNDKLYDSGLSKHEAEVLHFCKRYIDSGKVPNELYEGALVRDKDNDEIGFVGKILSEEKIGFITINKEGELKNRVMHPKHLDHVGAQIKEHINHIPKDFTHMILSVGGDRPNKKHAMEATRDFLRENLKAKGFDYLLACHNDTKNLHFHVIVKDRCKYKEIGTFRPNKFDLHAFRLDYSRHLDGRGINRDASLRYDRSNYLEGLERRANKIKNVDKSWWQYKLNQSDNKDFDALKFRKNALQQIDLISNRLEKMGEYKAAGTLRAQKDVFKKIEPGQINKVIDMTVTKLENEKKDLGETFKKKFHEGLGKPSRYRRERADMDKVADKYLKHVKASQEDLKRLNRHKLTPEIEKRREEAITKLYRLERGANKVLDCGMEMERGR